MATGAVLRALRKEDGPARIIQSSYGILRTEPHDPKLYEAHKDARPYLEPLNGVKYVKDTIDWIIKKVSGVKTPNAAWRLEPDKHAEQCSLQGRRASTVS